MEKEPEGALKRAANSASITLAFFPVSQYLGDAALRQAAIDLARHSPDIEKAADRPSLASFHPLSAGELKQKRDMDVYGLVVMHGSLSRTHIVTTNGVARTNPSPEGYICDSCHTNGGLKQDHQNSKLDGAKIPVWLCPDCSRLKPEERDVRF
jgi:hypothetical protein